MTKQTNDVTTNENGSPQAAPHRGSFWISVGILCAAFAVIVLIVGFYMGYDQLIKSNRDIAVLTESLNNKLSMTQQDVASLQKNLVETQQHVDATLANQQRELGELNHSQQGNMARWRMAEAQYLVDLANANLQVGDNIPLVIALLQTADQKIRDLSDQMVLPLRKALATDIAALQAVPVVDLSGIYVKLSALNAEVDKLPLPNRRPSVEISQASIANESLPWWRRGLHYSAEVLSKIVVVRYNKSGELPFIPPEQQGFLYQNLHATFEQALSAVVQRQPDIYRASLAQASQWIKQYFLVDAPLTQSTLTVLTELQSITLRPSLPTLSASLQAFHDYRTQGDTTEKSAATPAAQS